MASKNNIAIIPARYGSSRLPGKPLIELGGKPLIQWVYEGARRARLISKILIATDDERILNVVKGFGAEAVMTPNSVASGTDRIAIVATEIDADIVINIQGDEPFIEPDEVDCVAQLLSEDNQAVMGTLIKKIKKVDELDNPNIVKVVVDQEGYALYFSRYPIPYYRDSPCSSYRIQNHSYYKHIGLYSYRKEFLLKIARTHSSSLESSEKLEQLRVLENGYRIKTAETEFEPFCIDTSEDVKKAMTLLENKNKLHDAE